MKRGCTNEPMLFLYEPRQLLRSLVLRNIEERNYSVQSGQILQPFMQEVGEIKADNKILLLGMGGAGHSLFELLCLVRKMKSLKVKIIAWVPADFPWVSRLLTALYVQHVVHEEALNTQLLPVLKEVLEVQTTALRQSARRITQTELDILLQFAAGLSSREMAEKRGCSYKTIFSWKHNISEALELESHSQWLEMLTEITELSSLYKQG